MKILAVFIDMLGMEYLNLGNSKTKITSFDKYLQELGGVLYTNCYTPAPDTPRSSGCMWSGVYPKENGCNNRLKYPGKFLNTDIENLWDILMKNNYKLNIFLRKTTEQGGLLPYNCKDRVFNGNIDDFFKFAELDDNSFTFFYLPDLHTYLDLYGYNKKEFMIGTDFIVRLLKKILNGFGKECFDYIVMFSDHGFRCDDVKREFLLDNDRIKTLMYIRKKNDKRLLIDQRMRSNLDLLPTICEIIGVVIGNEIDGLSLFGNGHRYILLEDHANFSVGLGQTIEHWGVVINNKIAYLECDGKWYNKGNIPEEELLKYEVLIKEKMDDYEKNTKFYRELYCYKEDNTLKNHQYSDGSPIKYKKTFRRIIKKYSIFISKIFKYLKVKSFLEKIRNCQ